MIMCIRGAGILLLLGGLTVAAPGYAVAEPPAPSEEAQNACRAGTGPCAWLYETTENLNMRALRHDHRKAVSALLGFAVRGTPLCPEKLMPVVEPLPAYCVLNATGSDNISLTTGLGQFGGTVTVVVQEVNPKTGSPTPDSPEVVVARGRFTGRMDFSPAIVGVPDGQRKFVQLPLGSVDGHLSLDGFSRRVPFTGVFRLPFVYPPLAAVKCFDEKGTALPNTPLYLTNPDNFGVPPTLGVSCVAANEMAVGYPTVRFEISF